MGGRVVGVSSPLAPRVAYAPSRAADSTMNATPEVTPQLVQEGLERARYLTTPRVETVLYLTLLLEKPLLIEGPAGAGKTEIGKVLAQTLQTDLVRLQCYEGL